MKKEAEIVVDVQVKELDEAIGKAERLVSLLREAETIVNSLAERK